ncbi:hypothetical protein [Sulfuracidifex tepidarius]|uniref:Uncharacterized protein n=1 Tax=Sulfuracidifex tepidarius TaxID=1294262 RepID=A0A510DZD3_9CREN|nr:hypothetical protein [Sulfuracidifex tepidarius]BBG22730.1 hypothetical protein IC006_0014 [Sulfuracidifex tepidarius]BBG25509.1 hypothetical protein IC007_0014 [Sulfuracidifex tepidarius]
MKIEELYIKLKETKDTLNIDYMKGELQRLKGIAGRLHETSDKLDSTLKALSKAREMIRSLQQIDFEDKRLSERLERLTSELRKISRLDNPDNIVDTVAYVNREALELVKDVEATTGKAKDSLKEKLEENNKALKVYARVLNQFLEEDVEVRTFYSSSTYVTELYSTLKEAEAHLNRVKEIVIQKIKERNMDQRSLNIMIDLIENGKIKVNKSNYDDIMRIISLLIEKGIQVEMSL